MPNATSARRPQDCLRAERLSCASSPTRATNSPTTTARTPHARTRTITTINPINAKSHPTPRITRRVRRTVSRMCPPQAHATRARAHAPAHDMRVAGGRRGTTGGRSSSKQAGDDQEDAKYQAHRGRGAHELPLSEALESLNISAALRHAVADISHLVRDPPRVQHEENADRDGDPIDAHGAVLPSGAHRDAVAASLCGTHGEPLALSGVGRVSSEQVASDDMFAASASSRPGWRPGGSCHSERTSTRTPGPRPVAIQRVITSAAPAATPER